MIRGSLKAIVLLVLVGILFYPSRESVGAKAGINCPPQPYQITELNFNAEFVDRQFQEVYLRFCFHVDTIFDTLLYNDSVTIDSLYDTIVTLITHELDTLVDTLPFLGTIPCDADHDTINDCGTDLIFLNTQVIELRDEEDAATSPELKWFEDTDDGASSAGIRGRALAASYTLTLPSTDGTQSDELLVDDTGGLWWHRRNLFATDGSGVAGTIYADTLQDDTLSGVGALVISADNVHFANTGGSVLNDEGKVRLQFHEHSDSGNNVIIHDYPLSIQSDYELVMSDTFPSYAPSIMAYNSASSQKVQVWYLFDANWSEGAYVSVPQPDSANGDTLDDGSLRWTRTNGYLDTIQLSRQYLSNAHYNVMLTWAKVMGAGAQDTFYVKQSSGLMLTDTSFVVVLPWGGGTKQYFWRASGTIDFTKGQYVGNPPDG